MPMSEPLKEKAIEQLQKATGDIQQSVNDMSRTVKLRKDLMVKGLEEQLNESNLPDTEKAVVAAKLSEYLKKIEKEEEQLDKIQEQFNEYVDTSKKDWENFIQNENTITKDKVIQYLNDRLQYLNDPNKIAGYKNLIREIEESSTLENLRRNIGKMKNPSKIRENYLTQYKNTYKRFYERLRDMPKYQFPDPSNVVSHLVAKAGLTEDDAKLFFFYVMNGFKYKKDLMENTVFLDNFLKNVYRIDFNEDSKEFVKSINSIIEILKTI